ncbi:MAG TPA: twin-arginine translocation signal domain-containing protein, partial [Candidatus Latescibacteria bacterium]|nr:twin-arginine translocation signal domain-containing protein [Candidatus Latescibacterota bacterium]
MSITRREFMQTTALAAGGLALADATHAAKDESMSADRPLFVSTWPFGKPANEQSLKVFQEGGSILDAVEQGIHVAEADASNPSVGIGGIPNAAGVVQLDACIMDGEGQRAGSVAAIEGILHPISVARRVMDNTKHVMLAGDGARQFALAQGFASVELLTEERRAEWEQWRVRNHPPDNHDTIALLGLDSTGHLAGGCSTSGWGYKLPGRVGDSPIIGSGLYVDGENGAAGATGLGENVMRYCASFLVVEYMRQGLHPEEACIATIRRVIAAD